MEITKSRFIVTYVTINLLFVIFLGNVGFINNNFYPPDLNYYLYYTYKMRQAFVDIQRDLTIDQKRALDKELFGLTDSVEKAYAGDSRCYTAVQRAIEILSLQGIDYQGEVPYRSIK